MENQEQNQKTNAVNQNSPTAAPYTVPEVSKPNRPNPQPGAAPVAHPSPRLSDAEAQAILTTNHLQAPKKNKTSNKTLAYLLIFILVVMAGLSVFFYEHDKNVKPGSQNTLLPNPVNNPVHNGNGTVNQDVQYCSNPINAALAC